MKNEYIERGDYVEIIVIRKSRKHSVLVDKGDFKIVSSFNGTWHLDNRGYIKRTIKGKQQLMHRLIMNPPQNKVIDHINGNTLDNRRSNLRIVTWGQNTQNIKGNKRSKTGIRGVSFDGRYKGRWRARLTVDGKEINLGQYDTKEEAEKAAIAGRKEHFPFSKEAFK